MTLIMSSRAMPNSTIYDLYFPIFPFYPRYLTLGDTRFFYLCVAKVLQSP